MKAHNKFRALSSEILSKINCIFEQHKQEVRYDSRPTRNLSPSTSPMPVPSETDVAEVTSIAELPGTTGTTCPIPVRSTTDVAGVSVAGLPGTAGIPDGIPDMAEIPSTVDVRTKFPCRKYCRNSSNTVTELKC